MGNVRLKRAEMRRMLLGEGRYAGLRAYLVRRGAPVLARAQASAPVDSGAYRAGLKLEFATTDRIVVRVVGTDPKTPLIESRTANLAKALDAAR